MTTRLLGALGFAAGLALAGCGNSVGPGGSLVGAACSESAMCASMCVMDKHYPGGMCSVRCASDVDCPAGAVCIDDAGGICAVACGVNADCANFGRGFLCDARDRRGAPGGTLVCRVP